MGAFPRGLIPNREKGLFFRAPIGGAISPAIKKGRRNYKTLGKVGWARGISNFGATQRARDQPKQGLVFTSPNFGPPIGFFSPRLPGRNQNPLGGQTTGLGIFFSLGGRQAHNFKFSPEEYSGGNIFAGGEKMGGLNRGPKGGCFSPRLGACPRKKRPFWRPFSPRGG